MTYFNVGDEVRLESHLFGVFQYQTGIVFIDDSGECRIKAFRNNKEYVFRVRSDPKNPFFASLVKRNMVNQTQKDIENFPSNVLSQEDNFYTLVNGNDYIIVDKEIKYNDHSEFWTAHYLRDDDHKSPSFDEYVLYEVLWTNNSMLLAAIEDEVLNYEFNFKLLEFDYYSLLEIATNKFNSFADENLKDLYFWSSNQEELEEYYSLRESFPD